MMEHALAISAPKTLAEIVDRDVEQSRDVEQRS